MLNNKNNVNFSETSESIPYVQQKTLDQIEDSADGKSNLYGKRTIGTLGSICLLVNNCLGPGLVQMNGQMQLSGWLPVVVAIFLFGLLSLVCCWMLLYAQSQVNSSLTRVEFTGICEYFFPKYLFYFCMLFYILTMMVQCISGIQQTTQLMDLMITRLFGESCALEIYPAFFSTPCSSEDHGFSVFAAGSGVISLGYLASALLAIPFGFFPLEESILFQIISCAIMAICLILLGVDLSFVGYESSRLPTVGTSLSGLVGLMMFNFSLAFSLPSWNNERKTSVSVQKTVGNSILIGSVTMVIIGVLAALAFPPDLDSDKNLIDLANSTNRGLTIAAVYIFSLANNVTTVPVFSIMIRYTLMEHKIIKKAWIANILAIALPWLLVVPFSTGSGFNKMIDFGGSIFIGVTCFVAPPILFICALRPHWIFKNQARISRETTAEMDPEQLQPTIPVQNSLTDPQFPPVHDKRKINVFSGASFALLAVLFGALVYAWYSSVDD